MTTLISERLALEPGIAPWDAAVAAARHGRAYLESEMPGSTARIDRSRLNIGDGDDCVLGQLFFEEARQANAACGYVFARGRLQLGGEDAARYGFNAFPGVDFPMLTQAWLSVLGA